MMRTLKRWGGRAGTPVYLPRLATWFAICTCGLACPKVATISYLPLHAVWRFNHTFMIRAWPAAWGGFCEEMLTTTWGISGRKLALATLDLQAPAWPLILSVACGLSC